MSAIPLTAARKRTSRDFRVVPEADVGKPGDRQAVDYRWRGLSKASSGGPMDCGPSCGAGHRAALRADPLAHPGMTNKSGASRACETPASFG
jgi:hypothetical protein